MLRIVAPYDLCINVLEELNMDYRIEQASQENSSAWLQLRERIYTSVDRDFHCQEMKIFVADDDKECFLVFAPSGQACAMIEVTLRNIVDGCLTSPVGYIEGIYVAQEHRGKGLSRRLMRTAEQWFRDKGCREIATDSEIHDVEAQQFQRHMGFTETFRIVEFRKTLATDPN